MLSGDIDRVSQVLKKLNGLKSAVSNYSRGIVCTFIALVLQINNPAAKEEKTNFSYTSVKLHIWDDCGKDVLKYSECCQWISFSRSLSSASADFISDSLSFLESYLRTRSYLVQEELSIADYVVFEPLKVHVERLPTFSNISRWFRHLCSIFDADASIIANFPARVVTFPCSRSVSTRNSTGEVISKQSAAQELPVQNIQPDAPVKNCQPESLPTKNPKKKEAANANSSSEKVNKNSDNAGSNNATIKVEDTAESSDVSPSLLDIRFIYSLFIVRNLI